MIQRIIMITGIQIVLYAIGIPMLVAYQMACDRLGPSCAAPEAPTAMSRGLSGTPVADLPR